MDDVDAMSDTQTSGDPPAGVPDFSTPPPRLDPREQLANTVVQSNRYHGQVTPADLASRIDHTLLKVDATPEQIDKLCEEAVEHRFKTVCVRPVYVERAYARTVGTSVGVCCVVSFHKGLDSTEQKASEASRAIELGAKELDVVLNRNLLHGPGSYRAYKLRTELTALRDAAPAPTVLKLILETSQLNDRDIDTVVEAAYDTGFDFVKTSTGFCGHGARIEDVLQMRLRVETLDEQRPRGRTMHVKASGGIRTLEEATRMLKVGAERLGVSAGIAIVQEASGQGREVNNGAQSVSNGTGY